MKKIKLSLVSVLLIIFLGACSTPEKEETKDYNSTNSTIQETGNSEKAEFAAIAEKHIKESYSIDNYKVDLKSIKVNRFPDDKNAETGEVYKNILNGIGDFTWQDQQYNFSLIYSKKDETNYSVLYLYSNLDPNKGIDTPLESDK